MAEVAMRINGNGKWQRRENTKCNRHTFGTEHAMQILTVDLCDGHQPPLLDQER